MICENCGEEIGENEKFCPHCGVTLLEENLKPLQRKYLKYEDSKEDYDDFSHDKGVKDDSSNYYKENDDYEYKDTKSKTSWSKVNLIIFLIVGVVVMGFAAGAIMFSGIGQLNPDIPIIQNQSTSPTTTDDASDSSKNTGNSKTTSCPKCGGSGWLTCSQCDGAGYTPCTLCDATGINNETGDSCSVCKGTGTVKCSKCNGNGQIKCSKCGGTGKV